MTRGNSEFVRKYFKNGCLGKKDVILAALNKKIPYTTNANKVASYFRKDQKNTSEAFKEVTIQLKPYNGNNPFAKRIIIFLEKNLKNDLIGAYAHGSVGSGEEVPYSDFDGFVIIKNNSLRNTGKLKQVALRLNQSEKIMTEMDPLQHHGWFILSEDDLRNYPEDYLPHELWEHASVLMGATELNVQIKEKGYHDEFIVAYHKFSNHLLKNINSKKFLADNYDLKSMLSGFMLLPSIYLQAKTGKGIFKKYSFELLKKELGNDYAIMDEVSALRANWNYQPSAVYKALLRRKPFLISYLLKKKLSGKPSKDIINKLNGEFIQRMISFIALLNKKISG